MSDLLCLPANSQIWCFITNSHIFFNYCGQRKLLVTMSPDWDWKNFGKKKKKSPHPHRRGDRPPETVNPRPLIDLKREAAFSDWHLFNTATLSRLLLRCLCQIRSSLCLSIMFRMLKHHLHPGFFLLFIWLCHLMEHQKVQGKLSSSVFFYSSRFGETSTCCQPQNAPECRILAANEKLFKVSFLAFFPLIKLSLHQTVRA